MEFSLVFSRLIPLLGISLIVLILPVYGQVNSGCTPTMITSVTPCLNFLSNSTGNGTSPSADCCNSLRNLTSGGMDCLCLIVNGNGPFQIPINRSLAISLPRACNMPGVPLQCRATGAPVPTPAPGPGSLAPTLSPGASPSAGPSGPVVPGLTPSSSPAPESDTTSVLTPPSPDVESASPTGSTGGGGSTLNPPSAAVHSYSFSPSLLLVGLGFVVLKYY